MKQMHRSRKYRKRRTRYNRRFWQAAARIEAAIEALEALEAWRAWRAKGLRRERCCIPGREYDRVL